MRRMLAIVNNPVFGGGTNVTMRLAGPLRDLGWDSLAMVPDLPEAVPTRERLVEGGVPTGVIELHRLRKGLDPRPNLALAATFRREVRALRELIRKEKIDVVQAFGPTNPHLALAGHLEGVGVVWTLYDTILSRSATRPFMYPVRHLADVVLTWGRQLAFEHPGATKLGDRCITVYPPVDPDLFTPTPERRAAARAELGVPDDALLIGNVGNRNPSKGHAGLVRAAAMLRSRGHDVWVRILGQRSPVHQAEMDAVDAEVQELGMGDRVAFVDPGNRVPDLLPALDIFAMSSIPRSEGVPTVLFEAMSTQLPVVTTDVGAVKEFITPDVGIVVPVLDDEALAAAIQRLVEDPQLRSRLGATGRAMVEEHYRVERCAEVYANAFELALAHRASR